MTITPATAPLVQDGALDALRNENARYASESIIEPARGHDERRLRALRNKHRSRQVRAVHGLPASVVFARRQNYQPRVNFDRAACTLFQELPE